MPPFPYPFWPIWLFSLGAAATIVLARIASRMCQGTGPAPLAWRECLALPAFATLATITAMQQSAPAASPLIAMVLAMAGFPRVAHAAARHILRK